MVVYVCKQTASICQVTIEMAVAPGDETKEMRLLHRDVDPNKRCQWEVLRAIPRPLGPGRVAVEVSARAANSGGPWGLTGPLCTLFQTLSIPSITH